MQKAFEKIVERLEEQTYDMEICEEQFDMNSPYFMDVPYKMVKMDDVKEIVNQVAETYEQEVCEWVEKSVDSIKLVREPHRLRLFHTEEDRQYCPYCGKRIFVKE